MPALPPLFPYVVSEKGQLTIPKELREQLGIRGGTVLEFSAAAGKLVAAKQAVADPFEKWVAVASSRKASDALMSA